jgi:hypothetical protein
VTGHPRTQRLAELLIRCACLRLPDDSSAERYREWTAEAYAILHDPATRPAARRIIATLAYAADQARGTRRASARPPTTSRERAWAVIVLTTTTAMEVVALITANSPKAVGPAWMLYLVDAGAAIMISVSAAAVITFALSEAKIRRSRGAQ